MDERYLDEIQATMEEVVLRQSVRPLRKALAGLYLQLDAALDAEQRLRAKLIAQCDGDIMGGKL